MSSALPLNAARMPTTKHIEAITGVLQEALGTPIDVNEVPQKERNGEPVVYWWRTAAADVIRGRAAFQYVQLQIRFFPALQKLQIDFLCLPESQKRQGKGRRVLDTIARIGRELGYKEIFIEAIEGSYPFWLKVDFEPVDLKRTSFPRPMVRKLD